MYNKASEQFNNLITQPGRTFRAKILIGETVLEGLSSIKTTSGSNNGEALTLGSTISQMAEITMDTPEISLAGQEFELQIGLRLGEDNYEYLPMGLFTPEKTTNKQKKTSFTAYDRMMKLSGSYVSNLSDETDTLAVLNEIATKTGVPIDVTGLAAISMKKPEGYTYREALACISQLYGCFANVNRAGTIELRFWENTGYELDADAGINGFSHGDSEFVVGKIVCVTSCDEVGNSNSLTSGNGTKAIVISNEFMTQEILDSIYEKVKGFAYTPVSCPVILGDPRLDPWDMIVITDAEGNAYNVPLMSLAFEYDGGLSSTIVSTVAEESEETNDYKGPMEQLRDKLQGLKTTLANFKKSYEKNEAGFITSEELETAISASAEAIELMASSTYAAKQTAVKETKRYYLMQDASEEVPEAPTIYPPFDGKTYVFTGKETVTWRDCIWEFAGGVVEGQLIGNFERKKQNSATINLTSALLTDKDLYRLYGMLMDSVFEDDGSSLSEYESMISAVVIKEDGTVMEDGTVFPKAGVWLVYGSVTGDVGSKYAELSGAALTWDGDITDKESLSDTAYKIASDIPEGYSLEGQIMTMTAPDMGIAQSLFINPDWIVDLSGDGKVVAVLEDGDFNNVPLVLIAYEDDEDTSLSKGIYFMYMKTEDMSAYISSLSGAGPKIPAWIEAEPEYTDETTQSLYYVDCLVYADDSYKYLDVMTVNSYTAFLEAKENISAVQKDLANNYMTRVETEAKINISQNAILSEISTAYTTKGETEIISASLELKVNVDELVSEINASADVITLNGNRFIVNSDNLKIAEDGTITAVDGVFSGEITCDEKITIRDTEANVSGEMSIEVKTISSGIFGVDLLDGSIHSASSARNVKCFVISSENGLYVDGDAYCKEISTLSIGASDAFITTGTFKDITASQISVHDCSVCGTLAVSDISINGTKLTKMLDGKADKTIQAVTVSGATEAAYSTSVTTNTRAIPSLCLVILNEQVTLTLISAVTAGTTINLGTISSYKPGANVAVTIWQNSTQARRYMGVLTNKGTIEMKSNMDMPAGTYYIYITATYIW